jgi:hypothetical protein
MIKPHVASSLSLQLIIKVYKIIVDVGIGDHLILHYLINSIMKTTLGYTNIAPKQE